MFGNELTIADTGIITILGLSVVFIVLLLLTVILELFKFIPSSSKITNNSPVNKTSTTPTVLNVSSLEKAIIISAILEHVNVKSTKQQIKINSIKLIS